MKNRAIIKLHYNCNNHCVFCHSDRHRDKSADLENIFRKITLAPKYGISQILLSGGEPTIHPQLKKIQVFLKENDLRSGFISNGRMFSYAPFLHYCIEMGAEYFYISLHSHKPELHDLITESEGSWGQAYEGIKNISGLASDTTELIVNCVVTRHNFEHLSSLVKLLSAFPGIIVKFSCPELKGRALSHRSALVTDLQLAGERISQALRTGASLGITCYYDGLPFCCIDSEFRLQFNNLEKSRIYYMSEVFEDGFFRTDESDRSHGEDCHRCSYYEICDGLYTGYPHSLIKPQTEFVPNFFSLHPVHTSNDPKQSCLLKMSPSQPHLRFKRIGVEDRNEITLYEVEDPFFKIKNFQISKEQGQLYTVDHKQGEEWTGAISELRQLTLLPECSNCHDNDCHQVFSVSSAYNFTDIDSNISNRLGEMRGNVLEVGFGDIFFKDILFGKLKNTINYVGLEPKQEKYARAVMDFPGVELYPVDLENFSYEKSYFDFILMAGSFNHIEDLNRGLNICHNLLKNDGRLLIIENSIFGLLNVFPLTRNDGGLTSKLASSYEHYRNASIETACKILQQANLEPTYQTNPCSCRHNFWLIECQKGPKNDQL